MASKTERRRYAKPVVVTEKVFEQAALACSRAEFHNPSQQAGLKVRSEICGYMSS